jgi:hypothetical protein
MTRCGAMSDGCSVRCSADLQAQKAPAMIPEVGPDQGSRLSRLTESNRRPTHYEIKLPAPPTWPHGGLAAETLLDISHHLPAIRRPLADWMRTSRRSGLGPRPLCHDHRLAKIARSVGRRRSWPLTCTACRLQRYYRTHVNRLGCTNGCTRSSELVGEEITNVPSHPGHLLASFDHEHRPRRPGVVGVRLPGTAQGYANGHVTPAVVAGVYVHLALQGTPLPCAIPAPPVIGKALEEPSKVDLFAHQGGARLGPHSYVVDLRTESQDVAVTARVGWRMQDPPAARTNRLQYEGLIHGQHDGRSRDGERDRLRDCGPIPLTGGLEDQEGGALAVAAGANVEAVQRTLGHASAAMTLDVYAGLFGDDLDAVATRLDEAVAARDADYLRTGTVSGAVIDLGRRQSPGR